MHGLVSCNGESTKIFATHKVLILLKIRKMRTSKILAILALFLLNMIEINAQTYCFTAPQGYGAAATGGNGGQVVTVTTMAELKDALALSGKAVILVKGSIQCDYLSALIIDKTILGLPGAKLFTDIQVSKGSGILNIKPGSNNVIIRNLIFEGPGAWDEDGRDCLTNEATNLWVDHCEFRDGMDGNFDNKGDADNVTVTWCKFTYLKAPRAGGSGGADDHRFTNLVSSSDSDVPLSKGPRKVTWQYCWWADGCVQRMVRARNATLHQVNCYWNSKATTTAIGLGAGIAGCSDYVESGVFACSGKISDLSYGGSPTIAFVNCTGGGSNVGTVAKPTYTYELTPIGSVVAAVTNSTCGAGATLLVTTAGAVSAPNCGTPPTNYTLTTNATNGTITRSPNATSYAAGTVVTLTATPSAGYQFSGWTGGASGTALTTTVTMSAAKTVTATFTVLSTPSLSLTSGTAIQSVTAGTAITSIVYTWGGTATGATVANLPAGLTSTPNTTAKTLTISGTPTASGTFTVTTTQSSGTAVSLQGTITRIVKLATPTGITATPAATSATINWAAVANATGYVVNVCKSGSSSAVKSTWDFTGTWAITAASADANLVLDATNTSRFNYVPATSNAAFTFANGTAVPDVEGLKFTQAGTSKVRLGFGTGLLYLNGSGIAIWIPCAVGDKITVVGLSSNAASVDRGFSVSGGTLNTAESTTNINSSGILTVAGEKATWVIDATTTAVSITSAVGGMNIEKIMVSGNSAPACTEYTVAGGTTTSYVVTGLTAATAYTYQVKATNATPSEASAYSAATTVTTTSGDVIASVKLKTGWNIIGCPISGSTDVAKALSSIWANVETVKNLDAFYAKTNAPALNSLTKLDWGMGYMVKVTAPCTLDWIVK